MHRRRRRRRRGYPLAILVGIEGYQAFTWNIYSESIKLGKKIQGDNEYNFYESIVNILRPRVQKGIKSFLVATPNEKEYRNFINHIKKHQSWLLKGWSLNTVTFEHIPEPALNAKNVKDLVKTYGFKEKLSEVSREDIQQVMGVFEKRLNDPEDIETLLFTMKDVENAVYGNEKKPEYILVTEHFRSKNRRKTQKLLQISANKNIKTKIIQSNTPEGVRIAQFGGLICMLHE